MKKELLAMVTSQRNYLHRADIDIGIDPRAREEIANHLSCVLADTYTLYLKTHNYHWNVTGPHFTSLHQLFETQYEELAESVDEIAERIRALGQFAPGTYQEFSRLSSISDSMGVPSANEMVADLLNAHESVVRTARKAFGPAEQVSDQPTIDLLTRRMEAHEKAAWMLRSMLER